MTYNPSIPQTGTRIDATYNLITTNFSQLNTIFANDHYEWNYATTSKRGRHKQVFFDGNPPALPSISTGQSVIFGFGGELFQRANADATQTQLTYQGNPIWKGGSLGGNGLVTSTQSQSGRMALPNGLYFIWGFQANPVDNTAVNFQGGGFPNNCFSVVCTPVRAGTTERSFYISTGSVTKAKFNVRTDSSDFDGVYYFAVGN